MIEHRLRLSRAVVLLHGPAGWGEWSPLPGYPSDPAACRRAAEEAATGKWPAPVRSEVRVNLLVPAVAPDEAARLAAGHTDVKVKVGDSSDVDRVAAVRSAIGPHARLRVDANGAWDVATAVERIDRMAVHDLELVEQPVASIDDLATVRRKVGVPIAADECVRTVDDARRLEADVLVVKVQPLGGFAATLRVIDAARLPVIVSSMFETSVGQAAGLALAAALDALPYACGLGTAALDVVADPLVPVDGVLAVRRPEPDPVLLARYTVDG
ncbi:MAG TPA: enolase C-terminal domain-like protein [Acidimicrobiales bacterium]|nr:enolase C-terminal domain-like protein [Acidimicrobiales bacterium]